MGSRVLGFKGERWIPSYMAQQPAEQSRAEPAAARAVYLCLNKSHELPGANTQGQQVSLIPPTCACVSRGMETVTPSTPNETVEHPSAKESASSHLSVQPGDGRTRIMTQLRIYPAESIDSQRWKHHFHIPQWP